MSSLIKLNQFKLPTSQVIENHITVNNACEVTGYNSHYFRRLLRAGRMEAIKIGPSPKLILLNVTLQIRNAISAIYSFEPLPYQGAEFSVGESKSIII